VTAPFEKIGFRVIGYNPGLMLCDAESNNGAFDLPLYAVKRLAEVIKEEQ